jgi:hypothetical protein
MGEAGSSNALTHLTAPFPFRRPLAKLRPLGGRAAMKIVENGKPSPMASGCAWGILGAPILFFGGSWLIGAITDLLTWLFG